MEYLEAFLQSGVTKLADTETRVAELKKRAAIQSTLLAEKQAGADAALKQITKSMTVMHLAARS